MSRKLKWIAIVAKAIPGVLWDYFTYMRPYAKHPEKYPLELRYAKVRKTVLSVLRKMHINPVDYESWGKLETKGKLLVGNHLSFLDPLILIALSPEPIGFVAKEEAKKLPFAGKIIALTNGCYIDRKDPIATLRAFKKLSAVIIKENMGYAIFPEGTRNKFPYGMMGEFHPGAFKLAQMANLDVLPVCLFGEQRILEEKPSYRNYPVQFHQGEVIPKDKIAEVGTAEFASDVRNIIDVPLQQMINFDRHYFEDGKQKQKAPKWWKPKKEKEPVAEETKDAEK